LWTTSEKNSKETKVENKILKEELYKEEEVLEKEFNQNLKIKVEGKTNFNNQIGNYTNNKGRVNFDGKLQNISRNKFSKIKNPHQEEPELSFQGDKVILVNNKGTMEKVKENPK
jgi:hypothetical protein